MKKSSISIHSLGEDFYDFLLKKREIIPVDQPKVKAKKRNDKKPNKKA